MPVALARRPPCPPIFGVLAFGLVLLPLVIAAVYPIAARLSFGWEAVTWMQVPTTRPSRYGGTAPFNIWGHGTGRGTRARITSATVWLGGGDWGGPGQINFGVPEMRFRTGSYGYDRAGSEPFTRDALLAHLAGGGFDAASTQTHAIVDAIMDHLQGLRDGRFPPDGTGQPYDGQTPSIRYLMKGQHLIDLGEYGPILWIPWYTPWCILPWVAAWWLASRPLVRRYRRRIAEYEAENKLAAGWREPDPAAPAKTDCGP